MDWKYFIGIDISKNTLDCAVLFESEIVIQDTIENSEKDVKKWLKILLKIGDFSYANSLFCMESTGIYNNVLIKILIEQKAFICIESAYHLKKSIGLQRGKNDKVDAERIALYAFKNKAFINLWTPKREVLIRLDYLTALRRRLIGTINILSVAIKTQAKFVNETLILEQENICANSLQALRNDLNKTEELIKYSINSDPHLNKLYSIVTSVEGVGPVLGIEIILTTNEFKNIKEGKKYACYAGVAPFEIKSGTSIKKRVKVSKLANRQVKSLLHMAAISSIQNNAEMKEYYSRKVAEGKTKMCAINAVRNKIILRVFACVRDNRMYVRNYTSLDARLNSLKAKYRALKNKEQQS